MLVCCTATQVDVVCRLIYLQQHLLSYHPCYHRLPCDGGTAASRGGGHPVILCSYMDACVSEWREDLR